MSRSFVSWLAALALAGGPLTSFSPAADDDQAVGRDLFARKWTAHDKRSGTGDGLGPMYNATSCAACHEQGGPGGAGSRQHNVDWLSVLPVSRNDPLVMQGKFHETVDAIHPTFVDWDCRGPPYFILHRFGPGADYDALRAIVLGIEVLYADEHPIHRTLTTAAHSPHRACQPPQFEAVTFRGIALRRTQRNTPALWGAGLIDSVSEQDLRRLAAKQSKGLLGVSGRLPPANEGGIGRFGWRGQTGMLREFVLAACANELGLQTAQYPQAINPLAPNYRPENEDLSQADVDNLVAFVANLPRPEVRRLRDKTELAAFCRGERVFVKIGCSACHVRQIGRIDRLYSDLLLHDMGPSLDDPVEANLEVLTPDGQFAPSYYSDRPIIVTEDDDPGSRERRQEWRTPPLWGVADSAPYLHDGRADTLADAIQLHGGEAAQSARHFRALSGDDRAALIFFLESQVAPLLKAD